MVAGTQPVLPPGYMSLWQAMDCICAGAKPGCAAMSGIERRLARLEPAVSSPETMHVWAGA